VKRICILFCLIALSGCTSISDLKKPIKEQYFALSNDYVRTQVRGWDKYKWVEGLKAGRYTSIGEDEEGVYFIGTGPSVIKLANDEANIYLQTGKISDKALKGKGVLESAIHVGGIWIPKKGIKADSRLFYEARSTADGSQFGLVGITIVNLADGSLTYIPYGSEKEFISSLNIIDK